MLSFLSILVRKLMAAKMSLTQREGGGEGGGESGRGREKLCFRVSWKQLLRDMKEHECSTLRLIKVAVSVFRII